MTRIPTDPLPDHHGTDDWEDADIPSDLPGEGHTKGLSELLEKVQAASGADREIDVMTECATGPWRAWSMSGGIVVPDGEPDYWVFNDEQADAFIAAYPSLQDRYARIPEFGTPFITDPAAPGDLYRKDFVSIHKNNNRRTVPSYTASIDAALALVERVLPGRWSEMLRWAMDNMWAEQAPHMLLETLPRHLVACALQALIAGSKP